MGLGLRVSNSGWPRRRWRGSARLPAPLLTDRMLIVARTRILPICVVTTMCWVRAAAGAIAPSLFKVHHLILIFEAAYPCGRAMSVGGPIRRCSSSARHANKLAAIAVHVKLLPCIRKPQCAVIRSSLGVFHLENDVPSVGSAFDLDLASAKCSDEALVSTLAR